MWTADADTAAGIAKLGAAEYSRIAAGLESCCVGVGYGYGGSPGVALDLEEAECHD